MNQDKNTLSDASAWKNSLSLFTKESWVFIPALTSSLLLYLSFFPVAWGWMGWVAMTPILWVATSNASKQMKYMAFWVCGLCFFTPALQWMRLADPRMYITWLALSFYCSLFFPVSLYFLGFFDLAPKALAFPFVWVLVEFLRSNLMGGFSWYLIGHSQHDFLRMIQISDLSGTYGVSFLVATGSGLLIDFITKPFKKQLPQAIAFSVALAATLAYGSFRLNQPNANPADFPICASLQGNVDQSLRNDSSKPRLATDPYLALSDLANTYSPDLIIWPETSYSREWHAVSKKVPEDKIPKDWQTILRLQKGLGEESKKRWGTSILLGLNSQVLYPEGEKRRYNSALLVKPDGEIGGRYDKIHRVPFGEFIPLKDLLPFLKKFAPYDFEYSISSGEGYPLLQFTRQGAPKAFSFATLICYEDTDSNIALPFFSSSQKPDFFVNISNDGWFKGSEEHDQHLAVARFRSIETRRAMIRSVNMGISCVIDGSGRILPPESKMEDTKSGSMIWKVSYPSNGTTSLPMREWQNFKAIQGTVVASVPIDRRLSPYTLWGDTLWYAGWMLLIWKSWLQSYFRKPVSKMAKHA